MNKPKRKPRKTAQQRILEQIERNRAKVAAVLNEQARMQEKYQSN